MSTTPKISPEVIVLMRELAQNNRLWGAERLRGGLLKLDSRVCKRTIGEVSETRASLETQRPDVGDVAAHS
jgi:hypothetical protein